MPPYQPQRTDRAMLNRIANLAAEQAVQKTFTTLGLNISTPEAVIEAQDMFRSMRNIQRDWKRFRNAFIGAAATALAGAMVMAAMHFHNTPPV